MLTQFLDGIMDGFQTVERDAMRIRPEFPNRFAQRFKTGHWCDWCVHNLWMSWLRFERVVLQDVALTVARLSRDRVASRLASIRADIARPSPAHGKLACELSARPSGGIAVAVARLLPGS